MSSCHGGTYGGQPNGNLSVALAGNPNVGKSSLFNRLTGLGVVTANYPGKTVDVNIGTSSFRGRSLTIIDLPGSYGIGSVSEDQWVARQAILERPPDVVIAVVDATNLARNLFIVLQFLDLGLPLVVALNMVDQAEMQGLFTEVDQLSDALGVPVVQTVAVRGEGIERLLEVALERAQAKPRGRGFALGYGSEVELRIRDLTERLSRVGKLPYDLDPRALAVLLLEGEAPTQADGGGADLSDLAAEVGGSMALRLADERHRLAKRIAAFAQPKAAKRQEPGYWLWRLTTRPSTGLPLAIIVVAALFAYLFFVGGLLSTWLSAAWAAVASPAIQSGVGLVLGHTVAARVAIWVLDGGISSTLGVGVPYILTFYLAMAFLEDSGYLNSIAFVTDRVMHGLGLHGRAMLPIIAGAGCNVPAIMGTRVLGSQRERVIACTLVVLTPCSARTAVILGAVALYIGWQAAVAIYGIQVVLILLTGVGLNRILPGRSRGLIMEVFPLRLPTPRVVLRTTWQRFKGFLVIAVPIVLVGSLVLGALYETGYLWLLTAPLSPVIEGWLGLPAVAGLTLVVAVLRKELALQLLITLAVVEFGHGAQNLLHFMSAPQIFIYALVNAIYIPCVATVAVLGKELGWWRTLAISGFTIALALVVGGLAHRLILALGVFG